MRSVARAFQDEFDEVTMSSTEVLEANVIAIRSELKEHKAAKDLQRFADRVEKQFSELRAENTEIRKTLADLTGLVIKIDRRLSVVDSRLGAIVWFGGGLIALVTLGVTVVKTFEWLYWL